MSADNSINGAERLADFWVFGGIFRPVYLESLPAAHISRIAVDAKADGSFRAEVVAAGLRTQSLVQAEILDPSGRVVGTAQGRVAPGASLPSASAREAAGCPEFVAMRCRVVLTTRVDRPATWTAETPSLYRVRVRLTEGKEEVIRLPMCLGCSTIEVRQGDGIYING
jgi:beta-galactosidase/beta-glucuronidase